METRRPSDPILVVDDDPATRELVTTALRHEGFDVRQAASGEAALELVAGETIGLLLLDMGLPGMSGLDVVRALREQPKTAALPIMVLTGKGDEYPLATSLGVGADAYLTKPIRLDELVARVRARLRSQRVAAEQALRESEELYRALVDQSADGILVSDQTGRYVEANPAICRMLGYSREALLAMFTPSLSADDDPLTPEDMDVRLAETAAGAGLLVERRYRRRDGTSLPAEVSFSQLPDGRLQRNIRDITDRLAAQAALEASERRLRTALDTMLDGVTIQSAIRDDRARITDFRIDYANSAIGVIGGTAGSLQAGRTLLEMFPAHRTNGLFDAYVRVVETAVPFASDDFRYMEPDAAGGPLDQVLDLRAAKLGDGYVLSARDVTLRHRAALEILRLSTAVEQSADSVVITNASSAIEYVNPAFERSSGYARDEVLGQNTRILKSGAHGPAFYAAMRATLSSGQSFVGDLTNRRKDGSLFQEETVISPVRDRAGVITSYVAMSRDVTSERASEAARARQARERARIARGLADIEVLPTIAATAEAICRQVVSLTGAATANLAYFTLEGPVMPVAFVRADGGPEALRRLPFQRSRALRERAEEGPWVEAWVHRPWHPYDRLFGELGVKAVAHAPIRHGGLLIGYLTVTSAESDAVAQLTESLPALLEFAGFAGALVGPAIVGLSEVGQVRERIADMVKTSAFRPVFQPIVDLATGAHAGYEALTRFSNGSAPDLVFADARASGQEADLELATLGAAISAAAELPRGAWLSLNVSPSLVTGDGRLAGVLRRADRPLVLEVTEHDPVNDYAALRAAIGRLRPEVRVAVDDAGSGVANFGHIVELRPAFVKLDIGLVRGIDADLTRQALMVGLLHFASASVSQTIAEGVETDEELATLRTLGVPLAQGYLLGRPAPVAQWAEPADN
ncbi:MAG: EAL domain-containing protein [Devosia sp.]|nr:EAL domain-containing protein [Devosia sp.]